MINPIVTLKKKQKKKQRLTYLVMYTRIFRKKYIIEIENEIRLHKCVKLGVQVALWLKSLHR